jgi:hypothetical protein
MEIRGACTSVLAAASAFRPPGHTGRGCLLAFLSVMTYM